MHFVQKSTAEPHTWNFFHISLYPSNLIGYVYLYHTKFNCFLQPVYLFTDEVVCLALGRGLHSRRRVSIADFLLVAVFIISHRIITSFNNSIIIAIQGAIYSKRPQIKSQLERDHSASKRRKNVSYLPLVQTIFVVHSMIDPHWCINAHSESWKANLPIKC